MTGIVHVWLCLPWIESGWSSGAISSLVHHRIKKLKCV